jgi:hypothetical protein
MRTIEDLHPLAEVDMDAIATIENLIDSAIDDARRRVGQPGSPLETADAAINVSVVPTTGGRQLPISAWRHAAVRYRLKGWSVSFAARDDHACLLIAL